jgi:hypothetical protein
MTWFGISGKRAERAAERADEMGYSRARALIRADERSRLQIFCKKLGNPCLVFPGFYDS